MWRQQGFENFRAGSFGNAGQNLYVSRAGILQRIHQHDLNSDGYFDLVFCNAQDYWEKPPTYIYSRPLESKSRRLELPADGCLSGTLYDINNDGLDDVVLGMFYDGIRRDLNARVYFGDPKGPGERRLLMLPAPGCMSTAAGDFNGDGLPDLAFLCKNELRIFYQSKLGFEPKRFKRLAMEGRQIVTDDLDGDGFVDMIVQVDKGKLTVYWGNKHGLSLQRHSVFCFTTKTVAQSEDRQAKYAEYVPPTEPLVSVMWLNAVPHLFMARPEEVLLIPVDSARKFGKPFVLQCATTQAVALGDVNGDGSADLVFACREPKGDRELSWIYWGDKTGFHQLRRTSLDTHCACDVAVGDLDGDGYDDIAVCQSHTPQRFTTESLIFCGSADGKMGPPVRLPSEDARRVFIARTSADERPQVVLVNHFAGQVPGRPEVSVFLGSAGGYNAQRRIDVAGAGAVHAICCDPNDDGKTDLVVVNCSENAINEDPGVFVFYAGDRGLPHEPSVKLPTTRAHGGVCADLDRDGYLDLIFCGFDNPDLLIFHGSDAGFDTQNPKRIRMEIDGVVYSEPRWIDLADYNNDGWLDLVVPMIVDDRSLILWGSSEGFDIQRRQVLSIERAASARAADLDGNGYLDLLLGGHEPSRCVPHDSFLHIYYNGPQGLRQDRRAMLPASAVNSMAVADFDNNGLLDVFVCSYHTGTVRDCDSYIYWNRKDRGFSEADRMRLFMHSTSGCVAADFNEDGWTDLAVANHKVWGNHLGWSAVWWNGPKGFSSERTTHLPTRGPHGMTLSPGNQSNRSPEEYFESSPYKLPESAFPVDIAWDAEVPNKTWVKAQLRLAATKDALPRTPWFGPQGPDSWFENPQAIPKRSGMGQWIQYRLALGARNGLTTPRVREVCVKFSLSDDPLCK